MRDYQKELKGRIAFLRRALLDSGSSGFVFGNSGGKDSALVGILCKMACENTVGVALPCHSRANFGTDLRDAEKVAAQFSIELRIIDLTRAREALMEAVGSMAALSDSAVTNIAPRLRMTALYALAAAEGRLVAGTGNLSERYMGYFTKWGDGAFDINPIADLTVTEVYEFLRYLDAPGSILEKAPSGGLYDGQTDEAEMGVSYAAIDHFLATGEASARDRAIIDRHHRNTEHKRHMPTVYESI